LTASNGSYPQLRRRAVDQRIANPLVVALGMIMRDELTNETTQALKRGSHTSIAQLRAAILAYVDAHNARSIPFKWVKTADEILDSMRRFGLRLQQVHGQ